jgi:lipopolysaccharide transport system ATP-binding protein
MGLLSKAGHEVLIRAENVGKVFCRDLRKSLLYGLGDAVLEIFPFSKARKSDKSGEIILRPGEFWANKEISFEVRRGECLGLIGKNGAGKTTLLRMLNGLIKPDTGFIETRGRVGAIIALGAGFNPILTGRENIFVNGSLLGLSKREIEAKVDDIIDFAEIGDFIDSPVQSYSSGMSVRLGFAVATSMEPILDEVLAVGDLAFRTKCLSRITSLMEKAAVIFVSHSEEQLKRICSAGLVLQKGRVIESGPIKGCLQTYRRFQSGNSAPKISFLDQDIIKVELTPEKNSHLSGDDFGVIISLHSKKDYHLSLNVLSVWDESGANVAAIDLFPLFPHFKVGENTMNIRIQALSLKPGNYHFFIESVSSANAKTLIRMASSKIFCVYGSITHWTSYTPKA